MPHEDDDFSVSLGHDNPTIYTLLTATGELDRVLDWCSRLFDACDLENTVFRPEDILSQHFTVCYLIFC